MHIYIYIYIYICVRGSTVSSHSSNPPGSAMTLAHLFYVQYGHFTHGQFS